MNADRYSVKQNALVNLIGYAKDTNSITDAPDDLWTLYEKAQHQEMLPSELDRLRDLVQEHVNLHVYTTQHAAAWVGVHWRTIQDAIYTGRIQSHLPGHDRVILHDELVRFNQER
jgi:hypothetical protein